jgi:hypothetical protein
VTVPQSNTPANRALRRSWARWLPAAMLVAGALGLIVLIASGPGRHDPPSQNQLSQSAQFDLVGDAKARSAVSIAGREIDRCAAPRGGSYRSCRITQLLAERPALKSVFEEADLSAASTATTYRITGHGAESNNTFTLLRFANGTTRKQCTVAGRSGCDPDGSW